MRYAHEAGPYNKHAELERYVNRRSTGAARRRRAHEVMQKVGSITYQ
jgi:hypothetical protein